MENRQDMQQRIEARGQETEGGEEKITITINCDRIENFKCITFYLIKLLDSKSKLYPEYHPMTGHLQYLNFPIEIFAHLMILRL